MTYGMNGWNKEIPGRDLISRAEAIEALGEKPLAWTESEYEQGLQNQWVWDVNALKALPSAQPERKKGKWIYGEDEYGVDGYHCDECGFFVPWDYAHTFINYIEDYKYCPNCGADMREDIQVEHTLKEVKK